MNLISTLSEKAGHKRIYISLVFRLYKDHKTVKMKRQTLQFLWDICFEGKFTQTKGKDVIIPKKSGLGYLRRENSELLGAGNVFSRTGNHQSPWLGDKPISCTLRVLHLTGVQEERRRGQEKGS